MNIPIPETPNTGTIFVNDIATLDCAFFDPSSGISGQSWHVDAHVTGPLDDNGFVYDFSVLKSVVRHVLKSTLDHTLIIPVGSSGINYSETNGVEHWRLHAKTKLTNTDFEWVYECPKGAVYPIRAISLKPSIVAQELSRLVKHRLSSTIQNINIQIRQETTAPATASYHYTHGISGHEGACQRLFHGHRAMIEVYQGPERRCDLEHFIVREVFGVHVHFATPTQVKAGSFEVGQRGKDSSPITLSIEGSLGRYEAVLPSNRVFIVEPVPSVECIAKQVAKVLQNQEPQSKNLRLVCYEGIGKGAVMEV